MSTALGVASPWYCALLRSTSVQLARMAQRLDPGAREREAAVPNETPPRLDALRAREAAEERLREARLRSLRYY